VDLVNFFALAGDETIDNQGTLSPLSSLWGLEDHWF
jgi:hypothetical protein